MIEEGETAPVFTLPGVRDGTVEQVAGEEFFGETIVVLAFYPGDFNPACTDGETGLDELDLFTMQKDVTVLAISADSVHSHLAFADQYNLHMPLLSDTDGTIASAYGVAVDDETAGYLTRRAVVVVDHAGVVRHTWLGEKPSSVPNGERIRQAITQVGDEETAQARYRVGHARYMEGRRAFTSAMKAFENDKWMIAQTDFSQAADEFDEAGEEFNTAIRFAEQQETRTYFERAEKKAESLWRAADWLNQSASAFSSGDGARGQALRSDSESPLETARELHDPPDPNNFPPETDPAAEADEARRDQTREPFVPDEGGEGSTASLDLDATVDEAAEKRQSGTDEVEPIPAYGNSQNQVGSTRTSLNTNTKNKPRRYPDNNLRPSLEDYAAETTRADEGEQIDDEELEAITAELEQQSEANSDQSETESGGDNVVPDEVDLAASEEAEEESDELSLSDPDETDTDDPDDANGSDDAVEPVEVGPVTVKKAQEVADGETTSQESVADDDSGDEDHSEGDDTNLDEVYTGVVDVSTDVIEHVGGEVVDPDTEEASDDGDNAGSEDAGETEADTAAGESPAEDEIDLDLTDPDPGTESDPDEEEDTNEEETDISTGDHGVPDSL